MLSWLLKPVGGKDGKMPLLGAIKALSLAVCIGSCSDEELVSPRTLSPPVSAIVVAADSLCARIQFTITGPTAVQTTFPNRTSCTTGTVVIRGPAATWAQNPSRRLRLFVRILNKSGQTLQLPVRVFLPSTGTVVIAPSGTSATKVVALNADSSQAGGGKIWFTGGTGSLIPNDSTSLDTLEFNVQSPVTQARFTFQPTANTASVPAIPPDGVPAWFYDDSSYTNNGLGFQKRVIGVKFRSGATQSERQAAVDAVGGSVIGGRRASIGEGFYHLLIADNGTGAQLTQAIQTLQALPQVEIAFLNYLFKASSRRPDDGSGWHSADWTLNPDSASGQNWALEQVDAPRAWGCEIGDTTAHVTVYDALFDSTEVYPNLRLPAPLGVAPWIPYRHGTRVSSVLAAAGNNAGGRPE